MCGIVGLIVKGDTGLTTTHESVFREMLYADAVRGFDSTGVVGVNRYGDFGFYKEAVQAAIFIPKLEASDLWKEMYSRGKVWIGHNRKKTVGEIDDASAHPFIVDDNFAMVHNGTLTSYKGLHEGAKTDSEALANVLKKAFDQTDWKKALEEQLGDVWGAYALAMFDQQRMKVYLLRNKERPLWRLEADNCHFFASEPMMAQWVLSRNGYSLDKVKCIPLKEHELHTYDLVKGMWEMEDLSPKKYVVAKDTTPSSKATHGATGSTTSNKPCPNEQALKHIRKQWNGKSIDFWVDTFFEHNMPKTLEDGETECTFFGHCDDLKWAHTLFADVDLANHQMGTEVDIYENKWRGIIDDISLSESKKELYITVINSKPYVKSTDLRTFFKNGLKDKSVTRLREELSTHLFKLTDWQVDAYNEAINKKLAECAALEEKLKKSTEKLSEGHDSATVSTKSSSDGAIRRAAMQAALEGAKSKGIKVGFKVDEITHQHVWFNSDTGEKIYESPAISTLH
jgi:predicted glutamine amidotransferase